MAVQHRVRVEAEFRSTWEAFKVLGLGADPHYSECQKFRAQLKKAGRLTFKKNGKRYKFVLVEKS